jgi:hypothetical protein
MGATVYGRVEGEGERTMLHTCAVSGAEFYIWAPLVGCLCTLCCVCGWVLYMDATG